MAERWKLEGGYFEACNCNSACPCVFLSSPTENDCTLLVAWHIDTGNFGLTPLSGLNAVLAVHSRGHMMEVKWKAALYVDQRASEDQRNALIKIFGGQAGGHPANLAPCIGEMLGVKTVPIEYRADGKRRSLSMGSIAEVEIESLPGQGGAGCTVSGHPLSIAPGFPAAVSQTKWLSYHDYGYTWKITDKTGLYSPFAYAG